MKNTKQIEEMTKDLASSIVWKDLYDDEVTVDTRATSVKMRDKGYRRTSEVVDEVINFLFELEKIERLYAGEREALGVRYAINKLREKYNVGAKNG